MKRGCSLHGINFFFGRWNSRGCDLIFLRAGRRVESEITYKSELAKRQAKTAYV